MISTVRMATHRGAQRHMLMERKRWLHPSRVAPANFESAPSNEHGDVSGFDFCALYETTAGL